MSKFMSKSRPKKSEINQERNPQILPPLMRVVMTKRKKEKVKDN